MTTATESFTFRTPTDAPQGAPLLAPVGNDIQVVCCDWTIRWGQETSFGKKDKFRIHFHSGQIITEADFERQGKAVVEDLVGKPFGYMASFNLPKQRGAPLNENSNIFKALKAWRVQIPDGKDEEFSPEVLIGVNALIDTSLNEAGTWVNVDTIRPLPPQGYELLTVAPTYVREKDRKPDTEFNFGANAGNGTPEGAE